MHAIIHCLLLGEEQLLQDPGGIFGRSDSVSDGSRVGEDLVVVSSLVSLIFPKSDRAIQAMSTVRLYEFRQNDHN